MSPSLNQTRQKLDRAEHHLDTLKNAIGPLVREEAYVLIPEFQNEKGRVVLHFPIKPDPDIPTILGDCLHNLRSSLDLIMGQLAILNGEQIHKNTPSFPIFIDPFRGGKEMCKLQEGLSRKTPDALTVLKGLQPYDRTDETARSRHLLWILHELSNIDKHRNLNITIAGLTGTTAFALYRGLPQFAIFKTPVAGGVLYDGAELELACSETEFREHDVDVKVAGAVFVALQEAGPWEHRPVDGLVGDILAYIRSDVVGKLDRFF